MKVKLLVNTHFGKPLKIDDIIDVSSEVATRWESKGICIILDDKKGSTELISEGSEDIIDYTNMTAKELFNLCKERKIFVDKEELRGKTEEERKAILIKYLNNK